MTTERAIELLNRISDSQFDGIHGDERREALEMAVRALVSQQIVNDSQGLVNDCISRKMAIDAVAKWVYDVFGIKESDGTATIFKRLRELPPAQPETHDKRTETHACDLISRQAAIELIEFGVETLKIALDRIDVTYNDREKFSWGIGLLESYIEDIKELPHAQSEVAKDTNVPNNDCISRQQAIDAMRKLQKWNIMREDYKNVGFSYDDVMFTLEKLTSAQPERMKGKWIWWYEEAFTEHATEYTPHCKCSECGRECAPSVATYSNFCRNCGADMRGESDE